MNLPAFHKECLAKKNAMNITAKELAEKSGVSQATVSRFFQNGGEGISFFSLRAIAETLGVEFAISNISSANADCSNARLLLQFIESLYEQMLTNKEAELKRSEKSRMFFVGLSVALIILSVRCSSSISQTPLSVGFSIEVAP